MLDTRLSDDLALRSEALRDRVAAMPIGPNMHSLKVVLAECDVIERGLSHPAAICKLRDVRHWLKLAYGHALHGYPAHDLRNHLLRALAAFEDAPSGRAEG